jgi:hypothetical protein
MTTPGRSLTGGLARGAVAGAIGTLAMDALWYARSRRDGGTRPFHEWELSSAEDFDGAGAPAEVGRRVVRRVLGRDLPDRAASTTADVVHWSTGVQWGALFGLAGGMGRVPPPVSGLVLGVVAWGTAYGVLGAAGIYQPIWQYDATTLAKDLSAHLVFGLASAAAFDVLRRLP